MAEAPIGGRKLGLELVRHVAEPNTKTPEDYVVSFIHWGLIREGLLCLGKGETFSVNEDSEPSELLPEGWSDGDSYAIKYKHSDKGEKYLLKAVRTGQYLTLMMMRFGDEKTTTLNFDVKGGVREDSGKYRFREEDGFLDRVDLELFKPLLRKEDEKSEKKDAQSLRRDDPPPSRYSEDKGRDPDPDMQHPPRPGIPDFPYGPRAGPDPFFDHPGRRDLDPFGGGGGGMLMEPPGRVPMRPGLGGGPRFDPIGPVPPHFGGGPGRRNYGDAMGPPRFGNPFM